MSTYLMTNERGETKRKTLRNCDRCCNIQDALGKFRAEHKGTRVWADEWRCVCAWLMEEVK